MRSEESEIDDYEEEEEDEPMQIPMPPSPEVPPSGLGIWWLVAVVTLAIVGYPMIPLAETWWEERKAKIAAAELPPSPPPLECRPVTGIAVNADGRSIRQIPEACLPAEAWAYYGARGHDDRNAAINAGTAFIEGKQPWREQP